MPKPLEKLMRALLTAVTLILATSSSMAAEWFVVPDLSNENFIVFFDKESYAKKQTRATVWLRSELSEEASKKLGVVRAISQWDMDCAKRTLTRLYTVAYSQDGKSDSSPGNGETDPVVPGTINEQKLKIFCDPNMWSKGDKQFFAVADNDIGLATKFMFKEIEKLQRAPAQ